MLTWLSRYLSAKDKSLTSLRSAVGMFHGSSLEAPAHYWPRSISHHQAIARFGSWAYAAAMLNAQAMASVPLRLYVRKRTGRRLYRTRSLSHAQHRYLAGEHDQHLRPASSVMRKVAEWRSDFEEVTEAHPALTVLASPSSGTTGLELAVLRMLYLQITGNAYLHPLMDETLGRPTELCLLPSQWTTIDLPPTRQGQTGRAAQLRYRFGRTSADSRTFTPEQIIHWKLPSLGDPFYGRGCVEAALGALDLHEAKRQMDLARYHNHARPDYLLIVKQGATAQALERFESQVENKLRGVKQSGKFITISGDVQATPLNFQSEKLGDSDRVLEEIAACFGVPISKLLANDPNRAGAQTADTAWMRDTILPYCRLDEERLNQCYLPLFGIEDDAFLAYDNPVPEDRRQAMQRRVEYVRAGIMTRNEARAEEGLEPVEDGDALSE